MRFFAQIGSTAAIAASKFGHWETLSMLIKGGADPAVVDNVSVLRTPCFFGDRIEHYSGVERVANLLPSVVAASCLQVDGSCMAYALQKAAPEATIKLLAGKGASATGSVVRSAQRSLCWGGHQSEAALENLGQPPATALTLTVISYVSCPRREARASRSLPARTGQLPCSSSPARRPWRYLPPFRRGRRPKRRAPPKVPLLQCVHAAVACGAESGRFCSRSESQHSCIR